jgi:sporulation protein YlmC with PRC-barrel domain
MNPLLSKPVNARLGWAVSRKHFAISGTLADRVISLAQILGRPVCTAAGMRIGRVSDIVVRWADGPSEHPLVTGVSVIKRGASTIVQQVDATLSQAEGCRSCGRPSCPSAEEDLSAAGGARRRIGSSTGLNSGVRPAIYWQSRFVSRR